MYSVRALLEKGELNPAHLGFGFRHISPGNIPFTGAGHLHCWRVKFEFHPNAPKSYPPGLLAGKTVDVQWEAGNVAGSASGAVTSQPRLWLPLCLDVRALLVLVLPNVEEGKEIQKGKLEAQVCLWEFLDWVNRRWKIHPKAGVPFCGLVVPDCVNRKQAEHQNSSLFAS